MNQREMDKPGKYPKMNLARNHLNNPNVSVMALESY